MTQQLSSSPALFGDLSIVRLTTKSPSPNQAFHGWSPMRNKQKKN